MNIEETRKITLSLIDTFNHAGQISLDLRKVGLTKEIKPDNSPVSNGDIEVNKILTSKIKEITPNIAIVSEESSNHKNDSNLKNFWLIDPIDGTRDYINNRDEFTLNAALIINRRPAIGIITAPAKKIESESDVLRPWEMLANLAGEVAFPHLEGPLVIMRLDLIFSPVVMVMSVFVLFKMDLRLGESRETSDRCIRLLLLPLIIVTTLLFVR